jgi:hypothetical protein
MSEQPPPYTGRSASSTPKAPKATPAKAATKPKTPKAAPAETPVPPVAVAPAAVAPATPMPVPAPLPLKVIWHSRAVLIGVGAFGLLAAILTGVGSSGFPGNAPVEGLYAFGVIIDMVAVAIALAIAIVVEYRRRADPRRLDLPVNTDISVFAIVAMTMAVLTVLVWVVGGGAQQLVDLAQGIRGRYMYHTGGLFIAGIPWVLSLVFGALAFRPRGNTVTNVIALAAVAVGGFLAIVAIAAALIYGAGLSD